MLTHAQYMEKAIMLAKKAYDIGEVPVGCVITNKDGDIIGEGYNLREKKQSALMHAEIIAIEEACKSTRSWRLTDCSLYVTLEPCPMCTGAIINSRIARVFYGAQDANMGACGGVINLFMESFGHSPKLYGGILEDECGILLSSFFGALRNKGEIL